MTAFAYFCIEVFLSGAIIDGDQKFIQQIARGLWVGLLIGLVYLGIEISTHQLIKLSVFRLLHIPATWLRPYRYYVWRDNELVAISADDLTRDIAPVPLLLWSALLGLRGITRPRITQAATVVLFVVAAIVVMISEHETSKVALLCSTPIFFVARRAPLLTYRMLAVAWVVACFTVIPVTIAMHSLNLHNAPWIQATLRHRIIIWNHTAEETLKSPLLGIGANMMYQLDPNGVKQEAGDEFSPAVPHAHNVFLQTWFELGVIGATLLSLFGSASFRIQC
jgi:hypothetical protein